MISYHNDNCNKSYKHTDLTQGKNKFLPEIYYISVQCVSKIHYKIIV